VPDKVPHPLTFWELSLGVYLLFRGFRPSARILGVAGVASASRAGP
jgi:hypothetical protein